MGACRRFVAGAQHVRFGRRELRPAEQPRLLRPLEVLAVDHVRAAVQIGQKQRRAKAGVADDDVGLDLRTRLHGHVHRLRMPHADLAVQITEVRVARGAPALVRDQPNAPVQPRRQPAAKTIRQRAIDERALHPRLPAQVAGDVSEMTGKLLVNKENVHGRPILHFR